MRYLIEDMVVNEGETAYVRLERNDGSHRQAVGIMVGLYSGKLGMRAKTVSQFPEWFAGEMAVLKDGYSAELNFFCSAFQLSLNSHTLVQIGAKKELKNGKVKWAIVIKIFQCTCGKTEQKREACICDMWHLKGSRFGRVTPQGINVEAKCVQDVVDFTTWNVPGWA
ncbi:hypothetical protein CC86DRAFT_81598 [Ophiobolus disseminans]|uniref:Uncharacterized protein n=1 Tax=Ophiobolus disseminans TaxID=1469910 RepID=A0A6A6ZQY9_9PLEO|nr:hypothetical protein CC86DRAFT_81598 [Ophiobolus disseminans]